MICISTLGYGFMTVIVDEERRNSVRLVAKNMKKNIVKGEEDIMEDVRVHQKKFAYVSKESYLMHVLIKECI